jgi:hypothetical protein
MVAAWTITSRTDGVSVVAAVPWLEVRIRHVVRRMKESALVDLEVMAFSV